MDFYNAGGVVVTDTTFITPNGDQYPIRNITSVQVREKNFWVLLILGIFFLLIGLASLIVNGNFASAMPSIFLSFILLIYWYFSREYILWIGSGGLKQKSITFPKRNKKHLRTLIDIADAINKSIANLQK
jgi:energy-coupling factor transporter transmembrane protein EcfT